MLVLIVPDTVKLVNVPILVILGWLAFVTVPAIVALEAVPIKYPVK